MREFATLAAALLEIADCCDLEGGPVPGLGEALLDEAARGIKERSDAEAGPGPEGWAPNAPRYAASAAKRGKPVGVLTGEMLDYEQIKGERLIGAREASMTYGFTPSAKQKATWFTYGRENQPARPLYEIDGPIADAMATRVGDHLGRYAADWNGR